MQELKVFFLELSVLNKSSLWSAVKTTYASSALRRCVSPKTLHQFYMSVVSMGWISLSRAYNRRGKSLSLIKQPHQSDCQVALQKTAWHWLNNDSSSRNKSMCRKVQKKKSAGTKPWSCSLRARKRRKSQNNQVWTHLSR